MTPVFCCGFECGGSGTVWPHFNIGGSGYASSISTSPVRTGARSLKIEQTSSSLQGSSFTLPSPSNIMVIRAYIRFAVLPSINMAVFGSRVSVTSEIAGLVFQVSDGKLYSGVDANGSLTMGASGFTPSLGQWYRVDIRANTASNPWLVDVQIDGAGLGQASYAADATSGQRDCYAGKDHSATGSYEFYIDDVIVSQTSVDYPIGPGYVNHFVPVSDDAHNVAGANDFEKGTTGTDIVNATTDSYLLVDDVPMDDTTPDADDSICCVAPPNATDYTQNVFGPASGVSTPSTGPRAVEVAIAHHEAGTGNSVASWKLNDNGTTDDIYNHGGAGVTTTRYARMHYAAMVGGGAWTAARFNALKIRFGYSSDANPDIFFDCAMIEAEWEEISTTNIKTVQGLARASVKTVQGLAIASVKSVQGLT